MTKAITAYPCGHTFQESAAAQLWVGKKVCPCCRGVVTQYMSNEYISTVAKITLSFEGKKDHVAFAQVRYPLSAIYFRVSEDTWNDSRSDSKRIVFLDEATTSIKQACSITYIRALIFSINFMNTSDRKEFLEYAKKAMPTFKFLEKEPIEITSYDPSKSSNENLQSAKGLFRLVAANNFFPEKDLSKIKAILAGEGI